MGVLSLFRSSREDRRPRIEPVLTPRASIENPATTLADPEQWFVEWATGGAQSFGPPVNERTAMAVSAVFRSVTLRAGIRATLPLKLYRRMPDGQRQEVSAQENRLARLLKVAPYPGRPLTAFNWRELWSLNTDLWGNHYSAIRYDNAGRIIGFEAFMPWLVTVYRKAGRNLYRCTHEDGTVEYVDQEDMIHIPGPGFDGIMGASRITHFARDSIALTKILDQQSGRVHENAAQPSGAVEIPASIRKDSFDRMRAQFDAKYVGRDNAGRVVFLDHGMKFTPFQMTPKDLTTIESRRYQVADISRFFGIPLHLLNETEKSTSWGAGLEEQNLAFLIYTMDAELSRDEAELNYKLTDGTDLFFEYDRDALLAMDPVKAAEIMQKEVGSGTLLINEYRRKKNRPPVEGGDRPLVNSTNVPLDRQLAEPAAPMEAANAP